VKHGTRIHHITATVIIQKILLQERIQRASQIIRHENQTVAMKNYAEPFQDLLEIITSLLDNFEGPTSKL
jgi:hypothetical protein